MTTVQLDPKDMIMKALKCELTGHILEALKLYEESIEHLRKMAESELDCETHLIYKNYLQNYEKHVQQLRDQVNEHMLGSKLIEKISVADGSRGHSYEKLFGRYLNETVTEVQLYEPHLSERAHIQNLVSFLELIVKNCPNLLYVRVITRVGRKAPKSQLQVFQQLRDELMAGNIFLNFQFDGSLHERKVVLSSGLVIKWGRGLHLFRPLETPYGLGMCDYEFRRCLATEVGVWKSKPFAEN